MKRKKIVWDWFGFMGEMPKEIVGLQKMYLGLVGTITASTYIIESPKAAFWVGTVSAGISQLFNFLGIEETGSAEIKDNEPK